MSPGSGSDWLSFNLYASTWQGFLLISLFYGLFGYLLSCLCIRIFRTIKPLIIVLVVLISSLLFLTWWLYKGVIINVVDRAGSCRVDADCVVAINPTAACRCPSAYSKKKFRENGNLILYEEYKKRRDEFQRQNSSGVICKPCQPNPVAICNEESYCSLISASHVEASLSQDERKLVNLVRKDLGQKLNIDSSGIVLLKAEKVEFNDSSLGCPQEGYSYLGVVTPGWKMLFEVEGKIYDYRMSEGSSTGIICPQYSRQAVYSCTKDSDCSQGLVCVGRGPTKPSPEIPGVCVSQKQSRGVQ